MSSPMIVVTCFCRSSYGRVNRVGVDKWHRLTHQAVRCAGPLAQAGLSPHGWLPKINPLGCRHQFQGENALHIIQNGPGFERCRTAHADVILSR